MYGVNSILWTKSYSFQHWIIMCFIWLPNWPLSLHDDTRISIKCDNSTLMGQ